MNNSDKQFIYDFLHCHQIGVLATVDKNNKPEAAVVEFGETEDLEIIFDTLSESYRKYKNLQQNKSVAMVVGWDEDKTLQYEGIATEIEADEKERCKKLFFQKTPDAQKWDSNPELRYFKITPTYIRYADYSKKPFKIIELKLE